MGTRPEALKMVPVIYELKKKKIRIKLCLTGQHREMLDQVTGYFRLRADYDLDVMKKNQGLKDVTLAVLDAMHDLLGKTKPSLVLVQGDTISAFASALAAFYHKIKIGHVEAGLRSHDIYSPYPEEASRKFISTLADFHFAPTKHAKENLLSEGIDAKKIWITGNTIIDTVKMILSRHKKDKVNLFGPLSRNHRPYILITAHRRENFGKGLENICEAVRELSILYPGYRFIFQVHPNPNVRLVIKRELKKAEKNISLI
ncbi:MAG TPA: UDP-N-acetylglucosamine 2-epimerase (non-hydrolyzing), partial [Cyclobacteriaceae bacterium]|nr:UDP-N-acetylglucosamine 2-epimerase (non-hydrolyzing) [Cyclobacteriaceae bacterium]